jgi:RNA polymerase sigma-70 factor (ECF subfamily)
MARELVQHGTLAHLSLQSSVPTSPVERQVALAARLRGIVETHADFVWRVLRRLGVPSAHVEDAAQEVFLVVAATLKAESIEHERAFLYRTAANVALHERRKRARSREVYGSETPELESAETPADERVDHQRARAALDDVLDEMDDTLREVFMLYELEELPMVEIAALTGLATGTVASRLRRAREVFRRRLPIVLARHPRKAVP